MAEHSANLSLGLYCRSANGTGIVRPIYMEKRERGGDLSRSPIELLGPSSLQQCNSLSAFILPTWNINILIVQCTPRRAYFGGGGGGGGEGGGGGGGGEVRGGRQKLLCCRESFRASHEVTLRRNSIAMCWGAIEGGGRGGSQKLDSALPMANFDDAEGFRRWEL